MDKTQKIRRPQRVANVLFAISSTIVGAFVIGLLYLEALSPAQLFVNDTENTVSTYLIGGTSPGVSLNVAPGESQLVDMPSWWGTPSLPRAADGHRVEPRWNLIFFKIYNLSDFPEKW